MYFRYFVIISPWKRAMRFIWKKTWIPITQECILPSLVEIGTVDLEKKIFKFSQCIFAISQLSPLGEKRAHSFEQIWNPFTQGCLVQVWLKLVEWFWRRRWKCDKFTTTPTTTTTTTTTDNGQILIRKTHLSLRLRWAKRGCTKWRFSKIWVYKNTKNLIDNLHHFDSYLFN